MLITIKGRDFSTELPNGNKLCVDAVFDEWPLRELRLRIVKDGLTVCGAKFKLDRIMGIAEVVEMNQDEKKLDL